MPCKPRMRGCRANCLHRQIVREYQAARAAAEAQREAETGHYAAELDDYGPILTFRDYLIGRAS